VGISREITCPFCAAGKVPVPDVIPPGMAQSWLLEVHFEIHVDELLASVIKLCPRCERYAHSEPVVPPADRLHRRCFAPYCGCACSFVRSLLPVFLES
jgi:hypothetical protein